MKLSADRLDKIRFAFVSALVMWALCTFSVFYEWLQTGEMFAITKEGRPYVSDFPIYYVGGKMARMAMHQPTNLYDYPLQDKILKELIAPVAPEQPFIIQYPPPFFVIAAFMPFVSMPVAWFVWVAIGDILFFLSLHYLLKDSIKSKKDFVVLSIAIASSFPFWYCDRMGQVALYVVPAMMLFWALIKRQEFVKAGISTALLLVKIQYLPFLGLVGLAFGRLKFFLFSVISSALVMFSSGLILGMPNVLSYPEQLIHGEYKTGVASGVNGVAQQNLRALLARLSGDDSPLVNKIAVVSCLVVAFIIFALWLKALKNTETQRRFKFLATLTMCCMLFFSPHTHSQDYLSLAVPAAWIWLEHIRADYHGPVWPKFVVLALPILSWIFFLVDAVQPPVPLFSLALPLIIWASWVTFITNKAVDKVTDKSLNTLE